MKNLDRMNLNRQTSMVLAAIVATTIGVTQARAAVVVDTDAVFEPTTLDPIYVVATNDLLQTSATLTQTTGVFTEESTAGEATLTDGQSISDFDKSQMAAVANGSLVFQLDTGANPLGYDISELHIYGGWAAWTRDNQKWTASYAAVDDPNQFITIGSVDYTPASGAHAAEPRYAVVRMSSDSGPLAASVAKIKFEFQSAGAGYNGYYEIDVMGAPVPEPASAALLAIGGAAMLCGTRRRN